MPDGKISTHPPTKNLLSLPKEFWTSPHTKAIYPASWTLTLPEGVLKVTPDFPDQELYNLRSISGSYWEGSVIHKR